MTKKEQAEFERLKNEVRLARAFHRTETLAPDVPPPELGSGGGDLTTGFLFNAHVGDSGIRVEPACSSSVYHGWGSGTKITTQGARSLYSTKVRALKAMRAEVESQCEKILADIDRQIEEEKGRSE